LNDRPPVLLFLVGAPAVGKMTVGHELARLTGLRLFHNHLSIEPALRFFDFGTAPFHRLVEDFRRGVFEEVAKSNLPGLIFTFAWAFDMPEDSRAVAEYSAPFRKRGSRVLFVELRASQNERLRRNETAFRLAEKPSKRAVDDSRRRLLEHDTQYRFESGDERKNDDQWLLVDNTELQPNEVAGRIIQRFGLDLADR
jgi:hypothetical protein